MKSDEYMCGTCKHASYDSDNQDFWCLNKDSSEYLEEKRLSDGCDFWEGNYEN